MKKRLVKLILSLLFATTYSMSQESTSVKGVVINASTLSPLESVNIVSGADHWEFNNHMLISSIISEA